MELKNRGHINVPGELLEIEIPPESFCLNKKSEIILSEDEEEIIECGDEEFLIDNDGIFGDYLIIKED